MSQTTNLLPATKPKISYKKWFRNLGWVCFILGFFLLMLLLSGLPDASVPFSSWSIILFPLGFIFLLIGLKGIVNRVIIICLFVLVIMMFFSSAPKGRAHDAAIQGSLRAMRAEAELSVVGNDYSANTCDQNTGPLSNLFKAIILQGASDIRCFIGSDLKSWAVSAKLKDTKEFFCSDSNGFANKINVGITSPSCAPVKAETSGQ